MLRHTSGVGETVVYMFVLDRNYELSWTLHLCGRGRAQLYVASLRKCHHVYA